MVKGFEASLEAAASAGGNADAVLAAHRQSQQAFEAATGVAPTRRAGRMYAGRSVLYEDCRRDLEIDIGEDFRDRVRPSLQALSTLARWIT